MHSHLILWDLQLFIFGANLKNTRNHLTAWDKLNFDRMQLKIDELSSQLNELQSSPCLINQDLEFQIGNQIEFLLKCQEI